MHNQPGPAAQQNEQRTTGAVELSLRIGQRARHQDFAGRRVTGVIRGLTVDSENALSAEVVLDDAIVLPPISEQDREVRIYRLHVPAHELTPFDERDDLIAELVAALQMAKHIVMDHGTHEQAEQVFAAITMATGQPA